MVALESLSIIQTNPTTFSLIKFIQEIFFSVLFSQGVQKPFKTVIKANNGDAQALGQKPITFFRQVCAAISHPELVWICRCNKTFPTDVKDRVETILKACNGYSIGSYSADLQGLEVIREHVAQFITKRDGFACSPDDIILSNGL